MGRIDDSLKEKEALPERLDSVPLNNKQHLFKDIVWDYVTKWAYANKNEGTAYPKALRLFLMGDPGSGKSTCTKATMNVLEGI